jgi:hypothetical protein
MLFKLGFVWQSLCPLKEEQKTAIGFQRKMTGRGDGRKKKQARNGLTKVNIYRRSNFQTVHIYVC